MLGNKLKAAVAVFALVAFAPIQSLAAGSVVSSVRNVLR